MGVSRPSRPAIKAQGLQNGISREKVENLLGCLTGAMPTIMDQGEPPIHTHLEVVAVGSILDQWWHGKLPRQIRQYFIKDIGCS